MAFESKVEANLAFCQTANDQSLCFCPILSVAVSAESLCCYFLAVGQLFWLELQVKVLMGPETWVKMGLIYLRMRVTL